MMICRFYIRARCTYLRSQGKGLFGFVASSLVKAEEMRDVVESVPNMWGDISSCLENTAADISDVRINYTECLMPLDKDSLNVTKNQVEGFKHAN